MIKWFLVGIILLVILLSIAAIAGAETLEITTNILNEKVVFVPVKGGSVKIFINDNFPPRVHFIKEEKEDEGYWYKDKKYIPVFEDFDNNRIIMYEFE